MHQELIASLGKITEEEARILERRGGLEKERYTEKDPARSDGKAEGSGFVIDSRRMLEAGELITVRTHTRFVHFPEHSHNYVEMVYMCAGETRHRINGAPLVLKTGELLIMNQNALQEIEPAGEGDIAVNFLILPEFFDQTLHMMGSEQSALRDFIISCLRSTETPVSYLHFKVSDVLPVQNLVENLVWTLMQPSLSSPRTNQFTMGLLFLTLMQYTDRIDANDASYEHELVMQALRYIETHYKNGELSALANTLGVEYTHLSRTIRNLTGFTYLELLQQKRMERAADLLSQSSLSVADVGLSVGYENLSYFHRLFRKYYGMSPRQWRVKHRGGEQRD